MYAYKKRKKHKKCKICGFIAKKQKKEHVFQKKVVILHQLCVTLLYSTYFNAYKIINLNNNLNKKLPQNLYEYWFASTDSYDRSTYLTNLALFFEALLAEIYYQQHGIKLRKKGLSDWAEEFDGLPQKLLYSRDNKGFDRIASDLHYVRNKIAHGDDVELSSWETAKTITDYVALYVYVIASYYHY